MERSRAYRRYQRRRNIRRKKQICHEVRGRDYYPFDGMYNKGKIHCSCWMCRGKGLMGEHLWTKNEIIAFIDMEEGLKAYEYGISFAEESEQSA